MIQFAELKIDALLVSALPNIRYLSGFTGSHGLLLVTPESQTLFTDPRYKTQASQESTCKIRISKGPLVMDLLATLAKAGVKRIGYEPARMTCDTFQSIQSHLPMRASLEPVTGWIEELRMLKSAAEIALIRRSVATNSRAFEQTMTRVKPGMRNAISPLSWNTACAGWAPKSPALRPSWPPESAPPCPTRNPPPRAFRPATWWWSTWAPFKTATPAT